ncbi:MAG: hypothetical protein JNM92_13630 [Zoogloea sp.]|nr:hypothetical protein [Zoogloea sp.]
MKLNNLMVGFINQSSLPINQQVACLTTRMEQVDVFIELYFKADDHSRRGQASLAGVPAKLAGVPGPAFIVLP